MVTIGGVIQLIWLYLILLALLLGAEVNARIERAAAGRGATTLTKNAERCRASVLNALCRMACMELTKGVGRVSVTNLRSTCRARDNVTSRRGRAVLVALLVLLAGCGTAGPPRLGSAGEVFGRVVEVHPVSSTLYFDDGRIVAVEGDTTVLLMDGRRVSIDLLAAHLESAGTGVWIRLSRGDIVTFIGR